MTHEDTREFIMFIVLLVTMLANFSIVHMHLNRIEERLDGKEAKK